MYKIIDFTDDLTAFAKGVLNALYKEDRFLTLYAAGTYVNTGWPSDEGYDSCIGFEKEIKTLIQTIHILIIRLLMSSLWRTYSSVNLTRKNLPNLKITRMIMLKNMRESKAYIY